MVVPDANGISCRSVATGLERSVDPRDDTIIVVLGISKDLRPDRSARRGVAGAIQDDHAVRVLLRHVATSGMVRPTGDTTLEVISEDSVLVTANEVHRREVALIVRKTRDCGNDRDLVGGTNAIGTDVQHSSREVRVGTQANSLNGFATGTGLGVEATPPDVDQLARDGSSETGAGLMVPSLKDSSSVPKSVSALDSLMNTASTSSQRASSLSSAAVSAAGRGAWTGTADTDMGSLASELADMAVDRLGEAFATSVW